MSKAYPYEFESLDHEINKKISQDFSGGLSKMFRVGPEKVLMPEKIRDFASDYYNLDLREGDVIVSGYPRSGTNLMFELVWLLLNDLDFEKANDVVNDKRIELLESKSLLTAETSAKIILRFKSIPDPVEKIQKIEKGPRVFKTHLHFKFLPPDIFEKKCKIIYLARHPKDIVVSYYHLQKTVPGREYNKDLKTFFSYFKNDFIMFTPYWAHIKQGWEHRDAENFKFVFYEDLTKDLRSSVEEMSKFLGTTYSSDQLDKLAEYLKFDNFQKCLNERFKSRLNNDTKIELARRGKAGGWKDFFDEEINSEANKWISENVKRIGIVYPFELD